jgi:hypothetical protein
MASLLVPFTAQAQDDIENVEVETYYISDANDATDTIGSHLEQGSRTYRIYLDLCADCSLRALYGDTNHVFLVSSTAPIFNHLDRGKAYGHEINNGALDENTLALDSWFSMGAASNQRSGIRKADDPDGSFVGGTNNDGGSAEIPGGLLVNNDGAAGPPLTERDGLVPLTTQVALPPNFNVLGDDPAWMLKDSTRANGFGSWDFRMGCTTPGVKGPTADNRILVAQITTMGELTFHLNVEIEHLDGTVVKYVSSDSVLLEGETANGLLNYPAVCGCTDPHFLEYDPSAGCDDGSCSTTIVFGCLDTLACNYDPSSNFHIQQLCCYGPNDCNGLDVTTVCPDVGVDERAMDVALQAYPNPTTGELRVDLGTQATAAAEWMLLDAMGRVVMPQRALRNGMIDVAACERGTYVLIVFQGGMRRVCAVVKQ